MGTLDVLSSFLKLKLKSNPPISQYQ